MYTNKKTIANSPYEEALSELRAAVPSLQAIADRAFALAAASEFGTDLLVMGAYSHSRLRQLILGGVTRHVLEHSTIPLMMHR